MLHDVTSDGGMGFCHAVLPNLLPPNYHGPLVVALDSNILIDLQEHGSCLLGDGTLPSAVAADRAYSDELDGLADLLNLWLVRDIRLVVTPRSRTDAKKITARFVQGRESAIDALANSLAFQFGDWNAMAPSEGQPPHPVGGEQGLPPGADRDLVLEAQAVGAHVFLTRDREILTKTILSGPRLAIRSPSMLANEFAAAQVQLFFGGNCGGKACPYADWSLPAPDTGKWSGLLSILGGE